MLSDKLWLACLGTVVGIFAALSVTNLTSWPAFWYDEAVAVEISHNFADTGVLNVMVAPHEFSPHAMMIGANGYPLTVPLAGIFKIAGFSLEIARAYMLVWCLALIAVIFFFIKKYFGFAQACAAGILILSFSSFFANGRTLTGEIPGFAFLLLGLWLLLSERHLYAGILLGLAAATKPSLYLLLCLPAAVDIFFFSSHKIKHLLLTAAGYVVPIAIWFALTVPWPISSTFIKGILEYYKNPFGSGSILGNISSNIVQAPHSSTLFYFGFLIVAIAVGWYFSPKESTPASRIYLFLSIVAAISFFYYLRSPGWLRYLLPLELCTLVLLPHFIQKISQRFSFKYGLVACIAALVLLQSYILFFHADFGSSTLPQELAAFLNRQEGTIGVINAPTIVALVPSDRTYQYISMAGIPNHGVNALSLPDAEKPKFLVVKGGYEDLLRPYGEVLKTQYHMIMPDSGYLLYERN